MIIIILFLFVSIRTCTDDSIYELATATQGRGGCDNCKRL